MHRVPAGNDGGFLADLGYLEDCLEQDQSTYSSRQLAQKLATERQVHLSPAQLRRILKKKG